MSLVRWSSKRIQHGIIDTSFGILWPKSNATLLEHPSVEYRIMNEDSSVWTISEFVRKFGSLVSMLKGTKSGKAKILWPNIVAFLYVALGDVLSFGSSFKL